MSVTDDHVLRTAAVLWLVYIVARLWEETLGGHAHEGVLVHAVHDNPRDLRLARTVVPSLALAAALLLSRRFPRAVFIVALASHAAWVAFHLPNVYDMDWWSLFIDAALALALTLHATTSDAIGEAAFTIRWMLVVFYGAAGVWKLNSGFLDHRGSCGAVFVAQLAAAWLPPPLVTSAAAAALVRVAPVLCAALECAIPCLLAAPSADIRRFGVLAAAALHLAILLTPPPHDIGIFGVFGLSRLFWVAPHAFTRLVTAGLGRNEIAGLALAVGVANEAVHRAHGTSGLFLIAGHPFHAVNAAYVTLVGLFALALHRGDGAPLAPPAPPWGARRRPSARVLVQIGAAAAYAFGGPLLGVIDVGASHMFANLPSSSAHGGNHLLLPTGLLLRALDGTRACGGGGGGGGGLLGVCDFGGGLVRVEASSSATLNRNYPGEMVAPLSDGALVLLRAAGSDGRIFRTGSRGGVRAALRFTSERPGIRLNGKDHPFVSYDMPAVELRRVLAELRGANESFTLRYARLRPPVARGGAATVWRRVWVRERGGASSCEMADAGETRRRPCDVTEVAAQPPPGWLASKLLVANPSFSVEGGDWVPCSQSG